MGKGSKSFQTFIGSIPDSKLSGFTDSEYTLYKDVNFKLNQQGLTTGEPQYYNIQVRSNETPMLPNRETKDIVAGVLVPTDGSWSPQKTRDALLSALKV